MDLDIDDLHSIAIELVIFQFHHHPNYHLHQLMVSTMYTEIHHFYPKVSNENLKKEFVNSFYLQFYFKIKENK